MHFDANLFELSDEKTIGEYLSGKYRESVIENKVRKILYNKKLLVFTLPKERECLYGLGKTNSIFISFDFQQDSNFFSFVEKILTEIKKIYPNLKYDFLQPKSIKLTLSDFTNFHPQKPSPKTKFKISSLRLGLTEIHLTYKNNFLSEAYLQLQAWEIYL